MVERSPGEWSTGEWSTGQAEKPEPGTRPADAARRALRAARGRAWEQTEEQPQQQPHEQLRDLPHEQRRDQAREQSQEQRRDQPREQSHQQPEQQKEESREQTAEQSGRTPERPSDAPPGTRTPRPGDAARAALRQRAAHAWRAGGRQVDAPQVGDRQGDTPQRDDRQADAPQVTDRQPTDAPGESQPMSGGSRPADLAREALRAARAEARRSAADPGEGDRTARRALRTGARPAPAPRADHAPDRVADDRARHVRNFLSGAFRMPSEAPTGPDEAERVDSPVATDSSPSPEGDPAPGPTPAPTPASTPAPTPTLPPTPRSRPRSSGGTSVGDHRRTFPGFPPRTTGEDGGFAETWWGNAWITALEEGALDAGRLARGRGYAEQGNVDTITVTPGLVLAYVQGSRPRPYRVQVRLRTLGEEDWERFLDAAVERPGHIAALLDKEMPESLAECGVPLLPGPGDLEPHCSCPDRGHPCKHAAALCYQTARLLDADPFVLLLLRGRGERELLDALSRRNATRAARAAQEQEPEPLPGVRATEALDPARRLPPLPASLPAPPHPEQPPAYPAVPDGPDSFALDQLATDAAARAHALLTTGHDEIGELTLWQDAVRIAASRPGSGLTVATRALYSSLASAAGRTPADLARAVAAWRQGGPDGLAVLEELWDPPAGRFDRARPLLLAADLPAFRPWRNHLTHPRGHVQLRYGRDGFWYPYESEPGRDDWWPRGTPDPDPVGALTGLGGFGDDL